MNFGPGEPRVRAPSDYVSYYVGRSGHGIHAVAFAALASSAREAVRLTPE